MAKKDANLGIHDATMIESQEEKVEELIEEPVPTPEKKELCEVEMIEAERVLRKYVKKSGGFREGISKGDRAKAEKLMAKLGRATPAWDETIHLTGLPGIIDGKAAVS